MDEDYAREMEVEFEEGAKDFKRPSQSLRPARLVLSESERVQRRWWNPDQLLWLYSMPADSCMAPRGAQCAGSLTDLHRRWQLSSSLSLPCPAGGQGTGQQLPG